MSRPRLSRGRLEDLRASLSERDEKILESIAGNRFMTSRQLRRAHFFDHASATAAVRSANRALARLADLGLIVHLERRIGGVRSGSGSNVWSLTEAGARLLRTHSDMDLPIRFRPHEPTPTFLDHTLAVAEVCLRLSEAARAGDVTVVELQREPACWRAHSGPHGGVLYLKPDLAVVTASGRYEDHWFLEIDRDTEPPSRVVRACQRYEVYRQTGMEQSRLGVFPAVVWVVPGPKRASTLKSHIAASKGLRQDIYAVVSIDDLLPLIKTGIGHAGAHP